MDRNRPFHVPSFENIVEARESLVDRNMASRYRSPYPPVEARESLVDRNVNIIVRRTLTESRGSREPRGSQYPRRKERDRGHHVEAQNKLLSDGFKLGLELKVQELRQWYATALPTCISTQLIPINSENRNKFIYSCHR